MSLNNRNLCNILYKISLSLLYCFSPEDDKDAPVQGPLPYEPDDAPWKKSSESGIRKLYVYSFYFFS